jgi:hypothetical protein
MITRKSNLATGNKVSKGKYSKFFNTIGLKGAELLKAQKANKRQNAKVLEFFKTYPTRQFTRAEIRAVLVKEGKLHYTIQNSSINRALNDLMNDRKVLKLHSQRMGEYGRLNHLWQLSGIDPQLNLFEKGGANE